jgi:hypothetical protein
MAELRHHPIQAVEWMHHFAKNIATAEQAHALYLVAASASPALNASNSLTQQQPAKKIVTP